MRAIIALFVYARVEHTKRTIQALLANLDAENHDVMIFSDAAKTKSLEPNVQLVREYIKNIHGFQSVTICHRPNNYGLANSIIEGVTEVLSRHERIIVLEDDMVTSPYFLNYMNEALRLFANEEQVISIHGYLYPINQEVSEAFFLRGADCWGWATWRRGWALFNPDGSALLEELRARNLVKKFDFNGTYDYSQMLISQIKGVNDSWAIRWYASAFLAEKLTLYPSKSLVLNIGNDSSGTHCGTNTQHDSSLSTSIINLSGIEVKHSESAFKAFENYFRNLKINSLLKKIYSLVQACKRIIT
jgi:hypothetical protein